MCNIELIQLTEQRKNALKILKQWEIELNSQNNLESNANPTKVIATYDTSIVNEE